MTAMAATSRVALQHWSVALMVIIPVYRSTGSIEAVSTVGPANIGTARGTAGARRSLDVWSDVESQNVPRARIAMAQD